MPPRRSASPKPWHHGITGMTPMMDETPKVIDARLRAKFPRRSSGIETCYATQNRRDAA